MKASNFSPWDSLSQLDNFRIKRDKRHQTGQVEVLRDYGKVGYCGCWREGPVCVYECCFDLDVLIF